MNNRLLIRLHSNRLAVFVTAIMILALLTLQFQPAFATSASPGFAPPTAKPYGKSLEAWGIEWTRYIMGLPADINPLNDPTGENCGVEQSGPVFFLVGTTGGAVHRDRCVVPIGKSLFFPIINVFCAVPEDGTTTEAVRSFCSNDLFARGANVHSMAVSVDGQPLSNPEAYEFISPAFSFTGDPDNIYKYSCSGRAPGECYVGPHDAGYSDGWWAFVYPLSPGAHRISIYAEVYSPTLDFGWTVDATYDLTVANK